MTNFERIKVGDIVRVEDVYHTKPYCYEVSEVHQNSVISEPPHFRHRLDDVAAIYMLVEKDFKCIWERNP